MGLRDSSDVGVKCPECGAWGAKKSLFKIKCVNPSCRKYDSERASEYQQSRISGKTAREVFPHLKGDADPGNYSMHVNYTNFRGDEIIYSADPETGYKKGEYLVIRVAPTGKRITFRLSSIRNRSDVESRLPKGPQPTPQERRVLNYHLRRGTSSRLFEKVREKYPDYRL